MVLVLPLPCLLCFGSNSLPSGRPENTWRAPGRDHACQPGRRKRFLLSEVIHSDTPFADRTTGSSESAVADGACTDTAERNSSSAHIQSRSFTAPPISHPGGPGPRHVPARTAARRSLGPRAPQCGAATASRQALPRTEACGSHPAAQPRRSACGPSASGGVASRLETE